MPVTAAAVEVRGAAAPALPVRAEMDGSGAMCQRAPSPLLPGVCGGPGVKAWGKAGIPHWRGWELGNWDPGEEGGAVHTASAGSRYLLNFVENALKGGPVAGRSPFPSLPGEKEGHRHLPGGYT